RADVAVLAAGETLDADHVGAEIGHQRSAVRSGDVAAEIEYVHAGQGWRLQLVLGIGRAHKVATSFLRSAPASASTSTGTSARAATSLRMLLLYLESLIVVAPTTRPLLRWNTVNLPLARSPRRTMASPCGAPVTWMLNSN